MRSSDRTVSLRVRLAVKRAIDIAGAAAGLLVLSPMLAWIALLVAATEGLPILFRQQRPGLGGQPFEILKFRTMRAPRMGEVWYLTDEERITPVGRFLRARSLDELPELWNVLRGQMSLVGPRPLLMEYLSEYTSGEKRRHDMRPGVTGWAAVNGRNLLTFKDRIAFDVWYVDHWSLRLDLRILLMTPAQVLRRQDVTTTEDLALGFPLPPAAVAPAPRYDASMAMTTDPVCGMRVDPDDAAATFEHEGTVYYFCSQTCRDAFEADPAAFLD